MDYSKGDRMGGNVFKDTHEVVRLPKEEYFKLTEEVLSLLRKITDNYPHIEMSVVQAMYDKTDFGDMDIVINTNDRFYKDLLQMTLVQDNNLPASRNGDVVSFLYKKFQIDLIFVPTESYSYSKNYFAWNDLGNVVGRLAKKLGFKHGHNGLFYVQRDGDVVVENHALSYDYEDILKILQLDLDKFKAGFNNALEMFEWAGKSPYFDPEIFKFENLNHINKVRDRKRVVYNQLVNWCVNDYVPTVNRIPFPDKDKRLDFVLQHFPSIKAKVDENDIRIALQRATAQKFNGRLVMQWVPELSGKKLGDFLFSYKGSKEHYSAYVLNASEEEIKQDVLEYYKSWTK